MHDRLLYGHESVAPFLAHTVVLATGRNQHSAAGALACVRRCRGVAVVGIDMPL